MYRIEEECSTIINTTSNSVTKTLYQLRGNMSDFDHIPIAGKSKKLLAVVFDNQCNRPILLEDKNVVIMSYSTYKRLKETIK